MQARLRAAHKAALTTARVKLFHFYFCTLFVRSAADGLLVTLVGAESIALEVRMIARMTRNMMADSVDLRADLFAGHGGRWQRAGSAWCRSYVGDHEVINGVSQADQKCRHDGRAELRQNDLEERLARGAAQIQGGIVQAAVQLAQLGADIKK